jgi:hypothetical protein
VNVESFYFRYSLRLSDELDATPRWQIAGDQRHLWPRWLGRAACGWHRWLVCPWFIRGP